VLASKGPGARPDVRRSGAAERKRDLGRIEQRFSKSLTRRNAFCDAIECAIARSARRFVRSRGVEGLRRARRGVPRIPLGVRVGSRLFRM
jgi:hypothetical protein